MTFQEKLAERQAITHEAEALIKTMRNCAHILSDPAIDVSTHYYKLTVQNDFKRANDRLEALMSEHEWLAAFVVSY